GDLVRQPIRLSLAEPAPCALMRLAASQHSAPRRARTVIRVFLGSNKGLAVGSTGALPLIWRSFSMPELDEGPMLQSQVRALEALLVHCGVENAPGAILVHGRPDIRERLQGDVFIQK